MHIKDLFVNEALTVPPGQNTNQPAGQEQDVGKLTATVSDLQKQVANLQKSALQQQGNQPAQTKPGEASQQQQTVGAVGTGQSNGTVAQKGAPVGATADSSMLDMIKKLAGVPQAKQIGQQPAAQKPQAPGVNQTPQMTNLKIKQDLAKTQGKST